MIYGLIFPAVSFFIAILMAVSCFLEICDYETDGFKNRRDALDARKERNRR